MSPEGIIASVSLFISLLALGFSIGRNLYIYRRGFRDGYEKAARASYLHGYGDACKDIGIKKSHGSS